MTHWQICDRPKIKDVTIMAADGVTALFGKLILPTNFDPKKIPGYRFICTMAQVFN
jgi:hypothetical protein